MNTRLTLSELQRIRQWLVAHRAEHPVEYNLWDAVLTVWLMGWLGWLPALTLEMEWMLPLCLAATMSPGFYVHWRERAHAARRLRCDWLGRRG
jgi:hypothetical protein